LVEAVATAEPVAAPWRHLYPFASHFLDVGGHRLHYVDEGPRGATPLLLVHGNPTWSFFWRSLIERFAPERRVVAPDHLGCGLSDKPQRWPYRLRDHIDNLERLVLSLDLRDLTLGVHDWGGAIGFGFAARHPERVARLVVLNSAAFRSSAIPFRIAVCRLPWLGALAVRGLNGFALAAARMTTVRPLPAEVRAGYLAPYGSWRERVAVLRFVQDIPLAPGHPSYDTLVAVEEALPRFRDRPALVLWGERDWCFTTAFCDAWQRRLPGASVHRLPGAAHYVVEDAPEEVAGRVADFLARE